MEFLRLFAFLKEGRKWMIQHGKGDGRNGIGTRNFTSIEDAVEIAKQSDHKGMVVGDIRYPPYKKQK